MGHRLFQIDVLAVIHCVDSNAGMPMIGSRDYHRVDVFAVDYLAIIQKALASGLFLGFSQSFSVHVGNGQHFSRGVRLLAGLHNPIQQIASSPADSDDPDMDLIVSAQDLAFHRTKDGEGGAGACGGSDEVSAVEFLIGHANLLTVRLRNMYESMAALYDTACRGIKGLGFLVSSFWFLVANSSFVLRFTSHTN